MTLDKTGFDSTDVHLKKNKLEELRIGLREYLGYILLNIRVWEKQKGQNNQWFPTSKGVSVQIKMLPRILAELKKLEAKAWKEGLLKTLDYKSAGLEPPPKAGNGDGSR